MLKQAILSPEQRKLGNTVSVQGQLFRRFPVKEVCMDNRKFRVYSVSWLAVLARRSPRTIHALERKGSLPRPIYRLGDSQRWYTAGELMGYSKLIIAANLRAGRYKGGLRQSDWLKVNSFSFKNKLKETLKVSPELIKTRLDSEDAILYTLSTKNRVKFTERQVLDLIAD